MTAATTTAAGGTQPSRVLALGATELKLIMRNRTAAVSAIVVPLGVGLFWAFNKHASNNDRHPAKKDLVFKDVCEPKMKAIEDCVTKDINALKELLEQRFDNLERLVRNNGKDRQRKL